MIPIALRPHRCPRGLSSALPSQEEHEVTVLVVPFGERRLFAYVQSRCRPVELRDRQQHRLRASRRPPTVQIQIPFHICNEVRRVTRKRPFLVYIRDGFVDYRAVTSDKIHWRGSETSTLKYDVRRVFRRGHETGLEDGVGPSIYTLYFSYDPSEGWEYSVPRYATPDGFFKVGSFVKFLLNEQFRFAPRGESEESEDSLDTKSPVGTARPLAVEDGPMTPDKLRRLTGKGRAANARRDSDQQRDLEIQLAWEADCKRLEHQELRERILKNCHSSMKSHAERGEVVAKVFPKSYSDDDDPPQSIIDSVIRQLRSEGYRARYTYTRHYHDVDDGPPDPPTYYIELRWGSSGVGNGSGSSTQAIVIVLAIIALVVLLAGML